MEKQPSSSRGEVFSAIVRGPWRIAVFLVIGLPGAGDTIVGRLSGDVAKWWTENSHWTPDRWKWWVMLALAVICVMVVEGSYRYCRRKGREWEEYLRGRTKQWEAKLAEFEDPLRRAEQLRSKCLVAAREFPHLGRDYLETFLKALPALIRGDSIDDIAIAIARHPDARGFRGVNEVRSELSVVILEWTLAGLVEPLIGDKYVLSAAGTLVARQLRKQRSAPDQSHP